MLYDYTYNIYNAAMQLAFLDHMFRVFTSSPASQASAEGPNPLWAKLLQKAASVAARWKNAGSRWMKTGRLTSAGDW